MRFPGSAIKSFKPCDKLDFLGGGGGGGGLLEQYGRLDVWQAQSAVCDILRRKDLETPKYGKGNFSATAMGGGAFAAVIINVW